MSQQVEVFKIKSVKDWCLGPRSRTKTIQPCVCYYHYCYYLDIKQKYVKLFEITLPILILAKFSSVLKSYPRVSVQQMLERFSHIRQFYSKQNQGTLKGRHLLKTVACLHLYQLLIRVNKSSSVFTIQSQLNTGCPRLTKTKHDWQTELDYSYIWVDSHVEVNSV